MSKRRAPGLYKRTRSDGRFEWHIDKRIRRYGRLCESTGTSDEEEAARYLARRIEEIRQATVYGIRPRRRFRIAATRYLTENIGKRGIGREALALADMDAFIGDLWLDEVHDGSFDRYRAARLHPPAPRVGEKQRRALSIGTLNRNIGVARRVLEMAARKWRDEGSNLSWLAQAPLIEASAPYKKRPPYPLDWREQRLLFEELAPHLQRMAVFDVNTGARDQELCGLEWAWEQRVPELDTPAIARSVFLLPASVTKNGQERVLVLNDAAQSVIESVRGEHPRFVFTYADHAGRRDRLYVFRNTGWKAARRRAAQRYRQELGQEAPEGFRRVRVHDLRHTFGRRLRAAGVSLEDRQDLLGHKAGRVTTHYSAAEIGNLIEAANRVLKSRETPAPTLLRVIG